MSNYMYSNSFSFSSETLSLISQYSGSILVIKYGGSAMKDPMMQINIIENISLLHHLGIQVVLVHGGGYLIDEWLIKLNIKPVFHDGLRVTNLETMNVVEMVLSGHINKKLVSLFNDNYTSAIGLSGKDCNLVKALPIFDSPNNFTGKVVSINKKFLLTLLSNNFLPVIASIGSDSFGNTYNVNADTLAASVASSLKAEKLIFITDTPGVLEDVNDKSSIIKHLNLETIYRLKSQKIINSGMIPKIDASITALQNNVKTVHITDGKLHNVILNEILTSNKLGSVLVL